MYYPKFIPPKDMDEDVNPFIDAMIEAELERGFADDDSLKLTIDCDMELPDADDLEGVL